MPPFLSRARIVSSVKSRWGRPYGRVGLSQFFVWAVLLTFCLLLVAQAEAADDSEVAPDRPTVTNSAETVPAAALQIETGLEYARSSNPTERRLTVQATLRIGLSDRLEARLDSEPLVRLQQNRSTTSNGDVALGVKYRFLDAAEGQWWPALGVLPFVKLPVARPPIGSERPDVGLVFLISQNLPWQLSLDVNAGLVAVGQREPNGFLLQALASASLAYAVTEHFSPFVELFFASKDERHGRETMGVDGGVMYLLTRRFALDAAVRTTVAGQGPNYTLLAGVSLRFGR